MQPKVNTIKESSRVTKIDLSAPFDIKGLKIQDRQEDDYIPHNVFSVRKSQQIGRNKLR